MNLERDLERLALQEKRLRFEKFDHATAFELGMRFKAAAEKRGVAVAIEVRLHDMPLFYYAMPGTTPNNAEWIRRKGNVVKRYHRSSYAIGLSLEKEGTSLTEKTGAALEDFATHGGAFPIYVKELCVGVMVISGLPQREDHNLLVSVLAEFLGVEGKEVALD